MFSMRPALVAAAALALLVAGCAGSADRPTYPKISFLHLPQIPIDVARVETRNAYVSPATEPNVEHRFPVSPAATALSWGPDRLKPVGASGVARVVVERASVVEVPLERTKGIRGAFTNDQSEKYEGTMTVAVEILDGTGERRALVRATSKYSRTVPEDISLNAREKVWFEMTEEMMKTLNSSLEGEIRSHLSDWIKQGG